MYAGRNGLSGNVQAAVEYFRMGAEQHDASSHFGYGLALLKVRTRGSDQEFPALFRAKVSNRI